MHYFTCLEIFSKKRGRGKKKRVNNFCLRATASSCLPSQRKNDTTETLTLWVHNILIIHIINGLSSPQYIPFVYLRQSLKWWSFTIIAPRLQLRLQYITSCKYMRWCGGRLPLWCYLVNNDAHSSSLSAGERANRPEGGRAAVVAAVALGPQSANGPRAR